MERLLRDAHALARDWWDPSERLLLHPGGWLDGREVARATHGLLQSTAWWADGLLRRAAPGDRELAEVALGGVVAALDGVDDHEERVATGTALALVLRDHDLPTLLAADVRAAAAEVATADLDVGVERTSLVVLLAWLELEVGRWAGDESLLARGAGRARAVAADAGVRGHVAEHIGPTCTGVTLLGLSLWAERPPVDDLAPLGRALRDEVWHDLLAVWHPGLRTMVPPFSHAHGMDLTAHVGVTGFWLAWLVDGVAPVPPLHEPPLRRAEDLPMMFAVAALAGASEDVRALGPLVRAQPPRQGEWYDRVGERVWTGWTGGDIAVGAEWSTEDRHAAGAVAAAAVWRGAAGANAWLRLHQDAAVVEARVEHDDGVVRLVHGTVGGPVQLLVGGPGPWQVTRDEVTDGTRTWRISGVTDVTPVELPVPYPGAAWTLSASGDGIVLATPSGR